MSAADKAKAGGPVRYWPDYGGDMQPYRPEEDPGCGYVDFDDYETAAARVTALEAERDALAEKVRELEDMLAITRNSREDNHRLRVQAEAERDVGEATMNTTCIVDEPDSEFVEPTPEEVEAAVQRVRAVLSVVGDHASFAEICRDPAMMGNVSLCWQYDNLIIWPCCSPALFAAISKMVTSDEIRIDASSPLVYVVDGAIPRLPVAKRIHDYKVPHWLPSVIRPFSKCNHAPRRAPSRNRQS